MSNVSRQRIVCFVIAASAAFALTDVVAQERLPPFRPTPANSPANSTIDDLPLPVDEEMAAAAEIHALGGWYKLDKDKHVIEVNMVYSEAGGVRRDNSKLVETALQHVRAFPRLKLLLLKEGQATDEGLKHLRGMTRLERIYMWDASTVTDEGAAHLATLPNLQYIHLSNSKITDRAIEHWKGLPRLTGISLQGNRFSNRALEHAGEMKQLRELVVGLGENSISDDGLAHIVGLTNLERLGLQHSRVTDAGLKHLANLGRLRTLWLSGTPVTPAGEVELKKSLPDLNITGVGSGRQAGRRNAPIVFERADAPPKLAYLAWQVHDHKRGEPVVKSAWSADGTLADDETLAVLSRLVPHPLILQRRQNLNPQRAETVRPLVLWFEDNTKIEPRPLMPRVVTEEDIKKGDAMAMNNRREKYRISAAAPEKPFEWGESVDLQIRYAIESPRLVKE